MAKLFAKSGDPNQIPHSAASDQSALFANYSFRCLQTSKLSSHPHPPLYIKELNFTFRYVRPLHFDMARFANSRDPDQMPHFVVSDLGLHCLTVTLLG